MVSILCLGEVKTKYGNTCIFPFNHNSVQYHECMKFGANKYCAYEVDYMGNLMKYDECAIEC